MNYEPKPIDTSIVALSPALGALLERLAENAHDVWGAARMADGWTFGPARDDGAKKHPCLVPYEGLSETEKDLDRKMVAGTLKTIIALGWSISPPGKR